MQSIAQVRSKAGRPESAYPNKVCLRSPTWQCANACIQKQREQFEMCHRRRTSTCGGALSHATDLQVSKTSALATLSHPFRCCRSAQSDEIQDNESIESN